MNWTILFVKKDVTAAPQSVWVTDEIGELAVWIKTKKEKKERKKVCWMLSKSVFCEVCTWSRYKTYHSKI